MRAHMQRGVLSRVAREVCIPSVRAAARITADIVPDSRTVAYGHGFPSPIQPSGFSNNTIYVRTRSAGVR